NGLSDIRSITLNRLPDVLGKMIHHDRNYQLFNEDIFRGVISDMVWEMLNRRKLHLMSKLRLYKEICRDHRIGSLLKDIGYMVPKHLYNLLFFKHQSHMLAHESSFFKQKEYGMKEAFVKLTKKP